MSEWKKRWQPGRWVPDFVLPNETGVSTQLYGQAGGVLTLFIFCSRETSLAEWEELAGFLQLLQKEAPPGLALYLLHQDSPEAAEAVAAAKAFPGAIFVDRTRELFDAPATEGPQVVVIAPSLSIIDTFGLTDKISDQQQVAACFAGLPNHAPQVIESQAPVLLLPQILEAAACQHLIDVWHQLGHQETGVERSEEGQRSEQRDDAFKRRRDHIVAEPRLLQMLTASIGHHIIPQIQKVFAFRAKRFEGFKIACYEASERGHFRPHRDNLSPATKHRRFALSLNLNAGYEGGRLRFPEYAPHLYSPGAGGGVIFSSTLLHEVTEVTEGRRFALLSFLS